MAVKDVLLLGNKKLREKSVDVDLNGENNDAVFKDLRDTLISLQKKKKLGKALAAPQIGCGKKIILFNLPHRQMIMINPEIIRQDDEMMEVWETCFCFECAFFVKTKRFKSVRVRYWDEEGTEKIETFHNDLAALVQHEIDHLIGILSTDHLTDNTHIIMREEWEKTISEKS